MVPCANKILLALGTWEDGWWPGMPGKQMWVWPGEE